MALYMPHSIFHLARLLYVRPQTFGPYYVRFTLEYLKCVACFGLLHKTIIRQKYPQYERCKLFIYTGKLLVKKDQDLRFTIPDVVFWPILGLKYKTV